MTELNAYIDKYNLTSATELINLKTSLYNACKDFASEDNLKSFEYYVNVFKNQAFSIDKFIKLLDTISDEEKGLFKADIIYYLQDTVDILQNTPTYSSGSYSNKLILYAPQGKPSGTNPYQDLFSGDIFLQSIADDFWDTAGTSAYLQYTFKNCKSLKTINIGTVGNMEGTFQGCTNLEYVKIDYANCYEYQVFYNCPSLKEIDGLWLNTKTINGYAALVDYYNTFQPFDSRNVNQKELITCKPDIVKYYGEEDSIEMMSPNQYVFPKIATRAMLENVCKLLKDTNGEANGVQTNYPTTQYSPSIRIFGNTREQWATDNNITEEEAASEIEAIFQTKHWGVSWTW